jgi:hypothetical protein
MSADFPAWHFAAIAGYALLAHGVMLLNDGLYWDGWILESWQRNRSWPEMRRFFAEVGLAPLYYQHRFLAGLPHRLLAYRAIAFLALLLAAFAVYFIGRRIGLDASVCVALALLFLSYTGYHMHVDTVVGINYSVPMALFYWAALAALSALDHGGAAHWGLRIASLLLFALSFTANSTLVYYFGFLALMYGLRVAPLHGIDYILLPFVYWFLKNRLTPRHGHYANYNRMRPLSRHFPRGLLDALRFGLEASLTAPWKSAVAHHWLWLLAAVFFAAAALPRSFAEPLLASPAARFLAWGLALFLLAALPYALVAHRFFADGWGTRFNLLFHLPVALIVLGVLGLALPPHLVLPALAVLLAANAVHLNLTYLHYLAAWVKNRSWLHKLARVPAARQASVLLVDDRHSLRADPSLPEQEHRTAYLLFMFEWLWGERSRCGIVVAGGGGRLAPEQVARELAATTLEAETRQVDVNGAQGRVVIEDGARRTPAHVALLYLRKRYLPGEELEPFLDSVTCVTFVAL